MDALQKEIFASIALNKEDKEAAKGNKWTSENTLTGLKLVCEAIDTANQEQKPKDTHWWDTLARKLTTTFKEKKFLSVTLNATILKAKVTQWKKGYNKFKQHETGNVGRAIMTGFKVGTADWNAFLDLMGQYLGVKSQAAIEDSIAPAQEEEIAKPPEGTPKKHVKSPEQKPLEIGAKTKPKRDQIADAVSEFSSVLGASMQTMMQMMVESREASQRQHNDTLRLMTMVLTGNKQPPTALFNAPQSPIPPHPRPVLAHVAANYEADTPAPRMLQVEDDVEINPAVVNTDRHLQRIARHVDEDDDYDDANMAPPPAKRKLTERQENQKFQPASGKVVRTPSSQAVTRSSSVMSLGVFGDHGPSPPSIRPSGRKTRHFFGDVPLTAPEIQVEMKFLAERKARIQLDLEALNKREMVLKEQLDKVSRKPDVPGDDNEMLKELQELLPLAQPKLLQGFAKIAQEKFITIQTLQDVARGAPNTDSWADFIGEARFPIGLRSLVDDLKYALESRVGPLVPTM